MMDSCTSVISGQDHRGRTLASPGPGPMIYSFVPQKLIEPLQDTRHYSAHCSEKADKWGRPNPSSEPELYHALHLEQREGACPAGYGQRESETPTSSVIPGSAGQIYGSHSRSRAHICVINRDLSIKNNEISSPGP